jgi:hypothetical protein
MAQEGDECIAGIEMPLVMFQIVVGEEDLGDRKPNFPNSFSYVAISRDWPTAAQACNCPSSGGRFSKPSTPMPARLPGGHQDDFLPAARWAATCATNCRIWARSSCLLASVRTPCPA